MALLGDPDQVKTMLRSETDETFDADFDARLAEIRVAVSAIIEERTGRTFGGSGTAGSRVLYAGPHSVLLFDEPAASVTLIETGTLAGTAFADAEPLDSDYYVFDPMDKAGLIHGIRLTTGGVWGLADRFGRATAPVRVTGTWADDLGGTVPGEIIYVANYLMAERYKAQMAQPTGQYGPNGELIPVRSALNDPYVVAILDKYQAIKLVAL